MKRLIVSLVSALGVLFLLGSSCNEKKETKNDTSESESLPVDDSGSDLGESSEFPQDSEMEIPADETMQDESSEDLESE